MGRKARCSGRNLVPECHQGQQEKHLHKQAVYKAATSVKSSLHCKSLLSGRHPYKGRLTITRESPCRSGLILRFHEAKVSNIAEVVTRRIDTPLREYLYVHDTAAACVHVMELDQAPRRLKPTLLEAHQSWIRERCEHCGAGA